MIWRIDAPLALRPRNVTVTEAEAKAHGLPSSWTVVDACDGERVLIPGLGDSDCRRHDSLAVDFDPLRHEHRGFWALRRAGDYVLAIPHFDGPRPERFFPPPSHGAPTIPALGPEAYAALRAHLPLPEPPALSALSALELVASLLWCEPESPFHFDADDAACLDADRLLAATDRDVEATRAALRKFLADFGNSERAMTFTAAPAPVSLWLELPHHQKPYERFVQDGDRWGFALLELGLAGFPPPERSR